MGARLPLLGITLRTLQRWRQPQGYENQRQYVHRVPANKHVKEIM